MKLKLLKYFLYFNSFQFDGVFTTFPLLIFSYTCQQNVLQAFEELDTPNPRRMKKVVTRQIFLCSCLYIFVGTFGYLTFPLNDSSIQGNLLIHYGVIDHLPILIVSPKFLKAKAIIILTLSIFIAQPFNVKPTKEGLFQIIFHGKEENTTIHVILTLITHSLLIIISLTCIVNDIDMEKALTIVSGLTSPQVSLEIL